MLHLNNSERLHVTTTFNMLFQVNRVLAVPDSGLTCASHAGNAFVLKPEDGLFVRVSAGESELIISTLFYQLFY